MITTLSGAKFFLGPVATKEVDTKTEYDALTYVEIGEVEDYGEIGDESSAVTFAAVGDARVRKLKGARDAGTMQLIVGKDALDPGQAALKAAEKTKFEYAFKIVLADAPDEDYTDTTYYFRALVMSQRDRLGTNDNVLRTVFNLGINSEMLEVPAEEIEP